MYFWYIIIAIISYLLGSLNGAIEYSRRVKHKDIRECGSGNAGMTNMMRTYGYFAGFIVIVCDLLKTVIAMYTAMLIANLGAPSLSLPIALTVAALTTALGHCFPIYYGFKGGKGVLVSVIAIIIINPMIGVICLASGLTIAFITRMMSLGSICGAILYPILCFFLDTPYTIYALIISVFIIYSHRANIKRIMNGTENKLFSKKEN